jgi:predicted XRE-type DNA-binding protein
MGKDDKKIKDSSKHDHFPSDEELKKIRREMLYPDGDDSDIVAPPNASEIDLFKITLCQRIDVYRIEHQLKKKEVAKILEIDEARMSEMMNGKVESFSIERLFGYLKKLDPGYSLSFEYKELD